MTDYAAGIDLGGTRIKIVALGNDDTILDSITIPTGEDSVASWATRIRNTLDSLSERFEMMPSAIGLAAPGLAARDNRSIWWMEGRLGSLTGVDWSESLALGLPVTVLNDAHAALLAEARVGAARGVGNAAMLTLGTGVGGAVLCNGTLLQGTIGRAGHLGHLCLDAKGPKDIVNTPGSLEYQIGNYSLAERSSGRFDDTDALVQAVLSGDGEATRLWRESIRFLACAVTSIINIVDPEMVVIGGGIARAGKVLFEPLDEMLAEVEWRPHGHCVPVIPAKLQEWSGAVGAACFARERKKET